MDKLAPGRLKDVLDSLSADAGVVPEVVDLDAVLRGDRANLKLVLTALRSQSRVRVLSLRYNDFSDAAAGRLLAEYVASDTSLETLYVANTNLDEKNQVALAEAWSKNGEIHKVRNEKATYQRKVSFEYCENKDAVLPNWLKKL